MAAAGIELHPACRVRQEGFGLLFYDSRGPRLLFAETGSLLPADFFATVRQSGRAAGRIGTAEEGSAEIPLPTTRKGLSP